MSLLAGQGRNYHCGSLLWFADHPGGKRPLLKKTRFEMIVPTEWQDVVAHWMNLHDLTLSLDTNAYADGDVLADRQALANVVGLPAGAGVVQSITLLDCDDQGQALDIVILDSDVSLGTENAAVSIGDADAAKIIAIVEVAADDYIDLVNSQVACKDNLGIAFKCAAGDTSLYIGAISRGTGTYTAAGIKMRIGILQGL
jgi:hypothetical protein